MALDLETTGLNRERDRIIQYGIFGTDEAGACVSFTALVDAETPTGRDPRNIPDVSPQDVRAARPLREKHLNILHRALHQRVVVMHNGAHDWAFIEREFKRHGVCPPRPLARVCTYNWARRNKIPGSLTLGDLCQEFDIPLPIAHHAWYDARATFGLFLAWLGRAEYLKNINVPVVYRSVYFQPSWISVPIHQDSNYVDLQHYSKRPFK